MCAAVVVSIDAGHGAIKALSQIGAAAGPEVFFPSIAPVLITDGRGAAAPGMASLRVRRVPVRDKVYLVGIDAAQASRGLSDERQTGGEYCKSDRYEALMDGTLAELALEEIDYLMIGLPMTTIEAYREYLEEKYRGTREVPDKCDPTKKLRVRVRHVVVVAQPVGALFAGLTEFPELNPTVNLLLDTGFYTLDYLVARGKRPFTARAGAIRGGMSGFYQALHAEAAIAHQKQFGSTRPLDLHHYDYEHALTNGGRILSTFDGKLDLSACIKAAARKTLDDYRDQVIDRLEKIDDIENVILAGGGAEYMADSFKVRFPAKRVFIVSRPQFAISRGYLAAGVALASAALK